MALVCENKCCNSINKCLMLNGSVRCLRHKVYGFHSADWCINLLPVLFINQTNLAKQYSTWTGWKDREGVRIGLLTVDMFQNVHTSVSVFTVKIWRKKAKKSVQNNCCPLEQVPTKSYQHIQHHVHVLIVCRLFIHLLFTVTIGMDLHHHFYGNSAIFKQKRKTKDKTKVHWS